MSKLRLTGPRLPVKSQVAQSDRLNVIFMGTSEFAVPCLLKLLDNKNINLPVVVTVPDKPAGRSLEMSESPVKTVARSRGIPVLQPDDLRDPFFLRAIQGYNPDIAAVVAFRILPTELFTIPKMGCINLHASLLPELRGAAPIQWALIRGYKETGVSTFLIERKVDTGGLLAQSSIQIDEEDDAGSLSYKLSSLGAHLLFETVLQVGNGELMPQVQRGPTSLAPKITKELCKIDWTDTATTIHYLIRGLSPHPAAHSFLGDKIVKFFRTSVSGIHTENPGQITITADGSLLVGTGKGSLLIEELQLEGKKRMTSSEFLHGKAIQVGTVLH